MGARVTASFRDPSGFVYTQNGKILRQVNMICQKDYNFLISSGLYDQLTNKKYLIRHEEVDDTPLTPDLSYKVIQPEKIPFISYPFEWSFSQLKDAALLTLAIQKEALQAGMILKDASAYNIQFHHGSPILIDSLSLTKYIEGTPWVAYRQFCQHFLAPLALMSKTDIRLNKLLINNIDGIPLDLCSRLLPPSSKLNFGLLTHIHFHSKAQNRYADTSEADSIDKPDRKLAVTKNGLLGIIESLESTIKNLSLKISGKEWADYYSETNYSEKAFDAKKTIVHDLVHSLQPKTVLDLGANTGVFSQEAATISDCLVISTDIDPEAVELNYQQIKKGQHKNILPLILDLTNPSPAIGWDNLERDSFYSRGKVDVVLALALIHHLAIANNVPLADIARTLAILGEYLILEFVPKEDSQVKRLLRSREDIFDHYTLAGLIDSFKPFFDVQEQISVSGSRRTIFLFKRKNTTKQNFQLV